MDTKSIYHQRFEIGGLKFLDQNFIISSTENNVIKNCLQIRGIIGSNAVRNSVVKIDYESKKLYITNKLKNISTENYTSYRLHDYAKHTTYPYVKLRFEGDTPINVWYLLDTGFIGGLDASHEAANYFKKYNLIGTSQKGIGISAFGLFGENDKTDLERITLNKSFKISNLMIDKHIIMRVAMDQYSKIGYQVLKKLNPIFDFKSKKVYFSTVAGALEQDDREKMIAILYKNNRLEVATLWGKYMEMSKIGDEVLEIDGGKPAVNSICEVIMTTPLRNKKQVKLKNSKNEIYTLEVQ